MDLMTTSRVEISVIVPAFDVEKTLERCICSIIRQDFLGLEVIVVDDGSHDGTNHIARRYAAADHRIMVVRTPHAGVAAARNTGIRRASGRFLLFVDADDALAPGALKRLHDGQRASNAPVVVGGFDRVDGGMLNSPDGIVFEYDRTLQLPEIVSHVCKYLDRPNKSMWLTVSWGRLFEAALIKEHKILFEETLPILEDTLFNIMVLEKITKLHYVSNRLYYYQVSPGGGSQSTLALRQPAGLTAYVTALECARRYLEEHCGDRQWAARWVGQAYVAYSIIHLIRFCSHLNMRNFLSTLAGCRRLIELPQLRGAISGYTPSKGDSILLPFLIARRYALLTMVVASYKAWRRYGLRR